MVYPTICLKSYTKYIENEFESVNYIKQILFSSRKFSAHAEFKWP